MSVTVIVPAFNEEQMIGQCLDALLDQTVPADEIIVVDNNSTDATADIAKRYEKKGVRLITEKKQGLIPARDRGFDEAKYRIMGRIDADTMVTKDWVEKLNEIFEDKELAAVTGPSFFYDAPARTVGQRGHEIIAHNTNEIVSGYKMLWGSNMAITKDCWQAIKGKTCTQANILEDLDLAIHIAREKLKVGYRKDLVTGASARRFQSNSKHLYRYAKMWPETYKLHNDIKAANAVKKLIPMIMMVHAPIYVILRGYDPYSKSFSIKKFMQHEKFIRENP